MICYTPFWRTLKDRKISTYVLINRHKVSGATLTKLRNNHSITMVTLNHLCKILDCRVEDVIEYIPDEEE